MWYQKNLREIDLTLSEVIEFAKLNVGGATIKNKY